MARSAPAVGYRRGAVNVPDAAASAAIHTSIKSSFPESEKSGEERTRTVSLSTVVSGWST